MCTSVCDHVFWIKEAPSFTSNQFVRYCLYICDYTCPYMYLLIIGVYTIVCFHYFICVTKTTTHTHIPGITTVLMFFNLTNSYCVDHPHSLCELLNHLSYQSFHLTIPRSSTMYHSAFLCDCIILNVSDRKILD